MANSQLTVFENSKGKKTATYFEVIQYYKQLAKKSTLLKVEEKGLTDAGYPLHLIMISNDKKFDPATWHKQNKVVLMINNGIHPGEPDGIDASMMFVRDIIDKKISLPDNVAIGLIPVYNIGGALNRNSFSRVNQDGPESYGFRGNAENLDLNRDFTKCDSKNARSFAEIFHYLNPDVLVDTHVSDGADYQHTMSLISTQYNKLGPLLGEWVKNVFDPALYVGMKEKKWDMVRYVNVEDNDPSTGFSQFYDNPRYSSGFAALFNTISYMPETHMLKPYKDRVKSTYDLLITFLEKCSAHSKELINTRKKAVQNTISQRDFPLSWKLDTSSFTKIPFMGYEATKKTSEVSGMPVLFYDKNKPFSKDVKYFDTFNPENVVTKPASYIVPQGWWKVIDILKLNKVKMSRLKADTMMEVSVSRITGNKPMPVAYESHHKNTKVETESSQQKIQFLKGDYVINCNQSANKYIVEMLEPTGDDSFFSWNFFDAIFQQKEGYSDYRWNAIAEDYLNKNPDVRKKLEDKKQTDPGFAKSNGAQLNFVYKNSPWYEPAHMRYPVYKIMEK